MHYIYAIMASLSSLCEGVICGLRYAGISEGRSVSFIIPDNLRARKLDAPERLFNFLNLLFAWILTETGFSSVVMEWSAAGPEDPQGLIAAVRPESPGVAGSPGDLRRFASLPSMSALLEALEGRVCPVRPDLLELRVSLPPGEPARERPIEIEDVMRDLGEPDFCIDVIGEYMDSTRGLIERLEESLAARDPATVHRIAHTIKGGAFTIRASELRGTAGALEKEAKAGRLENGAFYLARIRDEYKNASRYFSRIRNEYRHGNKKNTLR